MVSSESTPVPNTEIASLQNLEGFQKLSRKQQEIIRASLYLKQRALRETPNPGEYRRSKKVAEDLDVRIYCHLAAYYLENEVPVDTKELPRFNEAYIQRNVRYLEEKDPSKETVADYIRKQGFPCAVIISSEMSFNGETHVGAMHTAIALGEEDGQIRFWHTNGRNAPFERVSLDELYEHYTIHRLEKPKRWGVRPMTLQGT